MDDVKMTRLHTGLPVSDVYGDKVGTLAHIYNRESATDPGSSQSGPTAPPEKIVEVKTGFLGLGRHLYVPAHAIETVTDDQIVLNYPRDELAEEDWSSRPPNLTRLT
jgi:hypothetical protein